MDNDVFYNMNVCDLLNIENLIYDYDICLF